MSNVKRPVDRLCVCVPLDVGRRLKNAARVIGPSLAHHLQQALAEYVVRIEDRNGGRPFPDRPALTTGAFHGTIPAVRLPAEQMATVDRADEGTADEEPVYGAAPCIRILQQSIPPGSTHYKPIHQIARDVLREMKNRPVPPPAVARFINPQPPDEEETRAEIAAQQTLAEHFINLEPPTKDELDPWSTQ